MRSNQLKLLLASMLAVAGVFVASAVGASAASAACYKVVTAGTGTFEKPTCEGAEGTKEYIKVSKLETEIKPGEWCAKVETKETGTFEDAGCTKAKAKGEFIKVFVTHNFWLCREGGKEEYENHLCAKKVAGGKWSYLPLEETLKVEGTSGVSKLESEVAGVKILIECKKDVFKGEIEKEGKNKGEVTFSECSLFEVAKYVKVSLAACTVPNIVFKFTSKLVTGQGPGPVTWGPEEEFNSTGAEETFVEIKVEGASCALKNTYKAKQASVTITPPAAGAVFKGQVCAMPEAGVGKVEHEIVCTSSGSHITFGGKPAYFTSTDTIKLENGWSWGAE
jgi:hypothetical protein